jgi:hypothetical protein
MTLRNLRTALLLVVSILCFYTNGLVGALSVNAPPAKVAEAKNFVTLAFVLSNSSAEDVSATLSLSIPEGWASSSSLSAIKIPANGMKKKLITVLLPGNVSSEEAYQVILSAKTGSEEASAVASISVERSYKLSLRLLPHEEIAWAGETITYTIEVINEGNGSDIVRILSSSTLGWKITPKSQDVAIPARGRIKAEVKVAIPEDITRPGATPVSFTVSSLGSKEKNVESEINAKTLLQVIPKNSTDGSLYRQFPMAIETKVFDLGKGGTPKSRITLRGSGDVHEDYTSNLYASSTFFGESSNGVRSQEDYFRLDTFNRHGWDVSLGSTEAWFPQLGKDMFGEGIRVHGKNKYGEAQVFYGKRRRAGENLINEFPFGVTVNAELTPCTNIGATYVHIEEKELEELDPTGPIVPVQSDLISGYMKYRINRCWALYGEAGTGKKSLPLEEFNGNAYLLGLSYDTDKIDASAEYYKSSFYYPGTLQDRHGYTLHADWQAQAHVSIWSDHEAYDNNIDGSDTDPTVRYERSVIGSTFSSTCKWPTMNLYAELLTYKSDEDNTLTDTRSKSLSLDMTKSLHRCNFIFRGNWDVNNDYFTNNHGTVNNYILSIDREVLSFYLTGTGTYRTTNSSVAIQDFKKAEIAVSRPVGPGHVVGKYIFNEVERENGDKKNGRRYEIGYYVAHKNIFADLRYRNRVGVESDSFDAQGEHEDRVLAELRYLFRRGHYLTLYLDGKKPQHERADVRSIIKWNYDFHVPVFFSKEKAQVKGRVFIDENQSGTFNEGDRPIKKTKVHLGKHTVYTHDDGTFTFPPVMPGEYDFNIDSFALPDGLFPADESHKILSLRAGDSPFINVPITFSGAYRVSFT